MDSNVDLSDCVLGTINQFQRVRLIFIFQVNEYPCNITNVIFFYIPRIVLEQKNDKPRIFLEQECIFCG